MKKFSLLALLFFALVLVGCGKAVTVPVVPVAEVDTDDLSNVPACVDGLQGELANATILNMDNLVKNCTEKKEKGSLQEGLDGGEPDIYKIYSGLLLGVNNGILAKDKFCIDENDYQRTPINGLSEDGISKNSLDKVIKEKLINEIRIGAYSYDSNYCGEADCLAMLDHGGWSQGDNYFIAGYRNGDLVYVINNKLYHPGKTKRDENDSLIYQSKWNFIGIKDNKVTVGRIKDSAAIGDVNAPEAYDLGTNLTLETCEIDL